jgi:phage baseplate assembly protein W
VTGGGVLVKTLALAGGDLVAGAGGHKTISGVPKIRQELALSLGEEYGVDRFHPDMGSILIEFIGQPIDAQSEMMIRVEVGRVIQQYIAIQQREVLRDHLAQRASRFDSSDVVTGITGIAATVNFDSVRVSATLITQAGTEVQISRTMMA